MSALFRGQPLFSAMIDSVVPGRIFYAGYRPDIKLDRDERVLYPVYPDFIDDEGKSISPLTPVSLPRFAFMYPHSDEVAEYLRPLLFVGQVLALHEGLVTQVLTAKVQKIFYRDHYVLRRS